MKSVPLRFFMLALLWPLASSAGVQLAVNGDTSDVVAVQSPWQFDVAWFVDDSNVTSCQLMYPGAPEGGLVVPSYSQSAPPNFRMDYFYQMHANANMSVDLVVICTDADGNMLTDQVTVDLVPAVTDDNLPLPPPPWVIGQVTPDLRVALLPYHPGDQVTFSWQLDPDRVKLDSCIGVIDRVPFQNISPIYDAEEPNNGLGAEDSTFTIDQLQGTIQITLQQSVKLEVDCEVATDGQFYFVGAAFPALDVTGSSDFPDELYASVDNQQIVTESGDSDTTVDTATDSTNVDTGNTSVNITTDSVDVNTGDTDTNVDAGNATDSTNDTNVDAGNATDSTNDTNVDADNATDSTNTDSDNTLESNPPKSQDSDPVITDVTLKLLSRFPRYYHLTWTSENSAFCALAGQVIPVDGYPVSQLPPSGETVFATPIRGSKKVFLLCQNPQGRQTLLKLRGKHTCSLCQPTAQTSEPTSEPTGNKIGIVTDPKGRLQIERGDLAIGPDASGQEPERSKANDSSVIMLP